MLIKIIKDESYINDTEVNISKFIGKQFYAENIINGSGSVEANMGEDLGVITIFEGEYEIVIR